MRAAVIGAGMSGLLVAHRLRQAGLEVTIFEKNSDVGGTWHENTYPGCRVDIASHFYSYACAQPVDWTHFQCPQPMLQEYFRSVTDLFGLREHIEFDTEITEARWCAEDGTWSVTRRSTVDSRAGSATNHHDVNEGTAYEILVSATGQLNRPHWPDIVGRESFAGPSFHSAEWDHGVDLVGRRVAVIGTGASAVQFVPIVAEQAADVRVYQRTPPWLLPMPDYQAELPAGIHWLRRHAPEYGHWDRLWLVARTQEGMLPLAEVDPEWSGGPASVGPMNEMARLLFTAFYDEAVADPDLRAALIPTYPPIAKRAVWRMAATSRSCRAPRRPSTRPRSPRSARAESSRRMARSTTLMSSSTPRASPHRGSSPRCG